MEAGLSVPLATIKLGMQATSLADILANIDLVMAPGRGVLSDIADGEMWHAVGSDDSLMCLSRDKPVLVCSTRKSNMANSRHFLFISRF